MSKSRWGGGEKNEEKKIWSCREKFPECQDRLDSAEDNDSDDGNDNVSCE